MGKEKAAVFILLGQSNAVGHGIPMEEKDYINTPLKNVFGLSRQWNQSFDNTELTWSGYTSFGMNLAEEQDNTYSVANCLAALWQAHIDDGNTLGLPDLYIVHIAIGAEGVGRQYMWYPEREKKLIPGVLGTVDISLFPFSEHIFSLLDASFEKMGKEFEIIGLHWRGGENEISGLREIPDQDIHAIYCKIFDSFNHLLHTPPIILHRIVCHDRVLDLDPTGENLKNMAYVNEVFEILEKEYANISIFDPREAPQYIPDVRGNGIFIDLDVVHFTPEVNQWVAETICADYVKKRKAVE